MLVLTKFKGV